MESNYQLLINKLNKFIREYYKNLIARGIIYSSLCLISILIVFGIVEHFNFFNGVIRLILFWAYCLIGSTIIARFILVPVIKMMQLSKSLSYKEAAKIIGLHFNNVSDKLLNILELNDINDGSQALINASIEQKIKEIELTPFNRAIDWRSTFNYSKFLIIPIGIVLVIMISGNKNIITDSTLRIINYNTYFEKPAPFYFNLNNDSLVVIEKQNFDLNISVDGEELPSEVLINFNNNSKKLKQISPSNYNYTFKNVNSDILFYISANEVKSKTYKLKVLGKPEIENISITIIPPKYTGLKSELKENTGSIQIPESSTLKWEIATNNCDTLNFILNNHSQTLTEKNNNFNLSRKINTECNYQITLANSNVSFIDTTFYHLKIIPDAHPYITINKDLDTTISTPFISGIIRDDYGFYDLISHKRIYGLSRDTVIKSAIEINKNLRSQSFIYSMFDQNFNINPGESIDLYFTIRDNDKANGYKATNSETITFNSPSINEAQEEYEENNEAIKNSMVAEMTLLKDLEKELLNFEKDIIEKDSLDWRDRKRLEEILNQHKELQNKIEEMKINSKSNFDKLNSVTQPSEDIIKKQQALEKLFDEIMPEEMKNLYKELNDLKDELQKDELQKKLQELQMSNEDLEKELDRNLEILKQVEFEQKLDNIINKIDELKKEQLKLSKNETKKTEEKIKLQKEHIEKFEEIKKEISEMKDLNNQLENKHSLIETKNIEKEIEENLNNANENLEKNNKKKASKSQKNTSEKLGELANIFEKMKKENQQEQHYEDMNVLRQILENLVYFSIEEENILLEFERLDKDDPHYVELMHTQQSLRDAARIIEDSLFALSKRVPQISSKVNREINVIDKKTQSAIDHLRERTTLKAIQDQQFIMTSANNLAVLLSSVLESMQQEMANDMPNNQQCEKPGKGAPKPGDLKRMQEELNQHLKNMQQQLEKGGESEMQKEGMSKKLVEMLAKQELIRQSLENLKQQMEDPNGFKAIEDAVKNMKQTEKDIANRKLTLESINRQKQILTRLLEIEESLQQQGEDDKRESKSSENEYERIVKDAYEKYELEKLKQTEMLKTTPPSLNIYYKNKVDRYFNLMLQ